VGNLRGGSKGTHSPPRRVGDPLKCEQTNLPNLELSVIFTGMCGRFALAQEHKELIRKYGLLDDPTTSFQYSPRYNIAPTQITPVVTNGERKKLKGMKWGLVPHWAKDVSIGNKLINARAETAADKPSFRDSFKNKRCLIPATGFFEWREDPVSKTRQPYYIKTKDQEIFSFAGLWSTWLDKSTGQELLTHTILTTEPNDFLKKIHNRMPVILPADKEDAWLDLALVKEKVQSLLAPYNSELMESYPVSKVVNSPKNDTPACIAPL